MSISDSDESNSVYSEDRYLQRTIDSGNESECTSRLYSEKSVNHISTLTQIEEGVRYFEIIIKQVLIPQTKDSEPQYMTFVNLKDVSQIIKSQQRFSDTIYQEAIENNYSHE